MFDLQQRALPGRRVATPSNVAEALAASTVKLTANKFQYYMEKWFSKFSIARRVSHLLPLQVYACGAHWVWRDALFTDFQTAPKSQRIPYFQFYCRRATFSQRSRRRWRSSKPRLTKFKLKKLSKIIHKINSVQASTRTQTETSYTCRLLRLRSMQSMMLRVLHWPIFVDVLFKTHYVVCRCCNASSRYPCVSRWVRTGPNASRREKDQQGPRKKVATPLYFSSPWVWR